MTARAGERVMHTLMRLRTIAIVIASATIVGLFTVVARLYYERVLVHVSENAIFFSAIHSDWAGVFILALLTAAVAPLVLVISIAYGCIDTHRRNAWIVLSIALGLGLLLVYLPVSVWRGS